MKLLEVQKEALRRSSGAVGFMYAMEQGLGKTLTAATDFLERVAEGNADRSIVVCPNSFKGGWVDEANKHGLGIDQCVFDSKSSHWKYWANKPSSRPKQLIVNYEAIRQRGTMEFLLGFMQGRKVFGIFDESIQISTFNSQQTKAAILLAKEFTYSRALSGKPMKAGPHDLWSQMRAIKQLDGFGYYPFKTTFCRMGGFKGKEVVGAQNEEYLGRLIDPYIFWATKDQWTDLPPKVYTIRDYSLTGELQAYFDQMYNDFVVWFGDGEHVAVDAAITKYTKLSQIQGGWIYDEDNKVKWLVPDERNPRLRLLKQIIDEEVTGKVAIAYHHRPVFQQLLRALGGDQLCAWITGGMPTQDIEEQKRRFNEDPNVRYILLQDTASKYGHTLLGLPDPAHRCSTMIMYENTYSLDTRSQIEDRIHRHGQTANSVSYIDLSGTLIDRKCIQALQRKESVFQAIVRHLS